MRAKYLWPCVAMCALVVASRAVGQSTMRWAPNLEVAKRAAAQTNRLILVHFWTESCGPCMRMEREVFSRPDVAAAIEANFIPVRVNVQNDRQAVREYGVSAWPSDVILNSQGGIVERRTGALDATQYVGALNQIAAKVRTSSPAQGYAQATPAPAYGSAAMAGPSAGPAGGRYSPQSAYGQQPPSVPPPADAAMGRMPSDPAASGGYGPQRQPPVGGVQRQTPGMPGAYADHARQSPSSSVNQLPSVAPAAQPQPQPWQPETAPWNSGAPRSGGSYGSMPSAGRAPAPIDQPPGAIAGANPPQQAMSGRPTPGAETFRGQPGAAPQSPPASEQRPSNPPLGLDGYCSVTLTEKEQWIKGDPRHGVIHRGRTYLFSGPDEAKRFFGDPDRYAPVLSGIDVVVAVEENRQVPGKREYGAWFDGRVYLFSSDTSLGKFGLEPARYAAAAAQGPSASARRSSRPSDSPPFNQSSGHSPYGSGSRY